MVTLDELIREHWETLVSEITKDAVRQIPSYGEASLQLTIERVERWLNALAESVARNQPPVLARHLMSIGEERKEEGYPIGDLHTIVQLTERYLQQLIERAVTDPVEQNGLVALLRAVMDSARMTLSVTYVISAAGKEA